MRTTLLAILAAISLVRADDKFAPLDDALAKGIARGDCPGAVVLVLHKGSVVYRKAHGKAAVEPAARAMTPDAVFDLASLTKPLATALSVQLLIEQGKLALDAPVAKYRPSFGKAKKDALTLEQLLLHTSGLIADNPLADYADGAEKALAKIDALTPLDPPGSRFRYSDVNYILLGHLVEVASGQSLAKFSTEKVFAPLGMKDTTFNPAGDLLARCIPTDQADGKYLTGIVHDPRARKLGGIAGHAGLFSTADDLARLSQVLLDNDGRVLPKAVVTRLTTPKPVPLVKGENPPLGLRTLGFDVKTGYSANRGERFPSGTSYGHTGFTGTSVWLDPASRTAVIFLSSRLHPAGKGNVNSLRGAVATLAAQAVLGK